MNQFDLTGFTGKGYDRGRPLWMQLAWMVVSRTILSRWWFPVRARVTVLRLFGADIGRDVVFRHGVTVHWPWKLRVGDGSWIGEGTWLLNLEPITIGANTCISQGVMLCTGSHDRRSPTFEFDNAPIEIGDLVWLATRATVLRGVNVGAGSTVGATALITRDVAPGSLVLASSAYLRESEFVAGDPLVPTVRQS
ncbi:putative colanic acid biosynthesis acetyltransferase [Gordonia sp. (in: high G+C Gram-positive bacteria)]|uniref:putative colanic acid biosynthesis acetyltransferase n=1 Tax=Gordonia sp. (in: high G+C Gram-positive bacteria) TaxID=84139 RepID=UPI00261A586D|nr:putative colanic acid biosynthesis acetyltransferase [Gordonia sp. (in: high G+C Gram-positive bacteria)]HMS76085.1 putative colanic acid biosynthesis acetyltransferase [Gordonia sp. (in: high G+C Gram-positive bacteria)]